MSKIEFPPESAVHDKHFAPPVQVRRVDRPKDVLHTFTCCKCGAKIVGFNNYNAHMGIHPDSARLQAREEA